jgi:hypothetical protein
MRRKWVVLLVALLGCSAFLLFNLWKREHSQVSHLCIEGSYFEPVKITEFVTRIPCVDIWIGDKTTRAKIDLGFHGDVSLSADLIKGIDDKSFIRRASYAGIRGKVYDSNVYELPKINIGRMALFRAKAQEINPEFEKDAIVFEEAKTSDANYLGRIGWALFHNFNFFLDCDNSLMAFCDSLDTLKKQGYPVDSFVGTPLLLDQDLIEFEVITEAGPLRCTLDTGSTWNLINELNDREALNLENTDQLAFDLEEDDYETSVFKIGKKDFGPVAFQKIKTPFGIDAIIGMEFLQSKLVFIDFPNRKIYFSLGFSGSKN